MASVQQSWSDYWKDGVKTSFGRDLTANYVGALADNWSQLWQQAQPGLAVLDIACGNGALTELCLQEFSKRQLAATILGIDYANIVETALTIENPTRQAITYRLQGNTNFLELDSANAQFDWLISQFGFEYIDRRAAISQVASLLRPGGQFRFVCHFYDSMFIRENQMQLEMNQFVDQQEGLIKLNVMLEALQEIKEPQQLLRGLNAAKFQQVINPVKAFTEAALAKFGDKFLSAEFMAFFRFIWSEGLSLNGADRLRAYTQFVESHQADTMRLQSMCQAAWTRTELAELPTMFANVDCSLQPYQYVQNDTGEVLAIVVQGLRNSA